MKWRMMLTTEPRNLEKGRHFFRLCLNGFFFWGGVWLCGGLGSDFFSEPENRKLKTLLEPVVR